MKKINSNIFSEVKDYLKLSRHLEVQLDKNQSDWIRFQDIFNFTLDKLYRDIVLFEKQNIVNYESEVYRRKKIFEKRYRKYFVCGEFIKWSLDKPFGYAGDFKIIDNIYKNEPRTLGFDRLWDNYFQQLNISIAIRERKEDMKKIILDFIKDRKNTAIRIMNLASGPAREIKELLDINSGKFSNTVFDCYDFDTNAINYAKGLLNNRGNVNFFEKNAVRLALKKDIRKEIPHEYDFIYSTGLFDYLDIRLASRLVSNLRKLVKKNGLMVIANVGEKYNNPSAGWMEWVAEWYLIYRTSDEFKKIFLDAGFSQQALQITEQKSKVIQYCLARVN